MINRRDFLGTIAATPLLSLPAPAAPIREPYVVVGEYVDSIVWHLWDKPCAPIGPVVVHEIQPWDGESYPIILSRWIYGGRRELWSGWFDHEWSNLRRDLPKDFWQTHSLNDYPNVHSYVRQQRFGEQPSVMREIMERNRRLGPPADRPRTEPFAVVP